MFTQSDLQQFESKGISEKQVNRQLQQFANGFPFSDIDRPATIGDGIVKVGDNDLEGYISNYEANVAKGLVTVKFVPASGAATRMFKELFNFADADAQTQQSLSEKEPYKTFFGSLSSFAFYPHLASISGADNDKSKLVGLLLNKEGLGYGSKPKGVLAFHRYGNSVRTASMEHLLEGVLYSAGKDKTVNIHFTCSPEHLQLFKDSVNDFSKELEKKHGMRFNITYSFQKPSTDTVAVDLSNNPFRNSDGKLVFRPAGHGALIENLNDLDADLVFIKNIDNVASEHLADTTVRYKKLLAGFALSVQNEVFGILKGLDSGNATSIAEAERFATTNLGLLLPDGFSNWDSQRRIEFLHQSLNRPVRVCGMVKNEGEPGGGPFWVRDSKGNCTLQVVESAQIDLKDPAKKQIFSESTHFNPVDLVCCPKDYKGKKFDLNAFVDHQTGFISEKSLDGRPLKALELPGLWNGAMAQWITFFVEVPAATFNPVKTVMDLLRPAHQNS